ncbi:MAG: (d)CMP kinase [Clostridia bacterium]|nr:(d)CMP kinase [Clostridia bacterium]
MKHFNIAIDGPAGAGKSSVARKVAEILGGNYLDTGAMYRAMGLYMLRNGIDVNDMDMVAAHCHEPQVNVRYENGQQVTMLGDEDVSGEIREEKCAMASSAVSRVPQVRERLVALQQQIARGTNLVMDGRDIGTKVLPNADVKIFLTASAEVRAQRRVGELREKGGDPDYEKILADIQQRDYQDTHRAASPLMKADDAIEVDTSDMGLEEVIAHICGIARRAI